MFEITTQIARPPPAVFAALAPIEEAPRWYSAVTSVDRLDDGPIRAGSRARFTRQIAGRVVANEVEVTEFDPDRAFALSSVSGPTPFSYRYELAPTAVGTQLELHGEISGEGLPGPLAILRPLAETFFKRGMATNLQSLKRLIESE